MERCKAKRIVKPIVYGNTASLLLKKREEDNHTHEWTVFVKPYYVEDLSKFIRKVQFKLHESYSNPSRIVERPPFEITETGWGEFEVQIRIFFVDVNEKPLTAFHYLRLFQPQVTLTNGKTIVAAEYYDEIIFQEPTVFMYKALTSVEGRKYDQKRFHTDFLIKFAFIMPLTATDCPKVCCSVIIPPIGVFAEKGCSIHLLINIILTLLGYIPGLIHACYIIVKY